MKNIKTIKVISPLPGLEVGDTLTRSNGDSNFELAVETVTDNYSAKRYISLSPSLINKDEFKAIEWFERIKTNKQKIAELEQDNDELSKMVESYNKNYMDTLDKLADIEFKLNKYESRMKLKLDQFKKNFEKIDKEISEGNISGERLEWAEEALTVYHNLIDLLNKIMA